VRRPGGTYSTRARHIWFDGRNALIDELFNEAIDAHKRQSKYLSVASIFGRNAISSSMAQE
jgi:hypothetical protein